MTNNQLGHDLGECWKVDEVTHDKIHQTTTTYLFDQHVADLLKNNILYNKITNTKSVKFTLKSNKVSSQTKFYLLHNQYILDIKILIS